MTSGLIAFFYLEIDGMHFFRNMDPGQKQAHGLPRLFHPRKSPGLVILLIYARSLVLR
jgi:hypothetical protein